MPATLTLDWHQLIWFLEGAARGSHLRWGVYEDMVNLVWPQLEEQERENFYAIARRNLLEDMERYPDGGLPRFRQMLARFDPAHQYKITLKDGRKPGQVVRAYLWERKYYVDWQRYCPIEFIKSFEQLPYTKCCNTCCAAKDQCLRFTTRKDGDPTFEKPKVWICDKCDFITTNEGQAQPEIGPPIPSSPTV